MILYFWSISYYLTILVSLFSLLPLFLKFLTLFLSLSYIQLYNSYHYLSLCRCALGWSLRVCPASPRGPTSYWRSIPIERLAREITTWCCEDGGSDGFGVSVVTLGGYTRRITSRKLTIMLATHDPRRRTGLQTWREIDAKDSINLAVAYLPAPGPHGAPPACSAQPQA